MNACIASSRVASYPYAGARASRSGSSIDHNHGRERRRPDLNGDPPHNAAVGDNLKLGTIYSRLQDQIGHRRSMQRDFILGRNAFLCAPPAQLTLALGQRLSAAS
jgi:hypothetical protein